MTAIPLSPADREPPEVFELTGKFWWNYTRFAYSNADNSPVSAFKSSSLGKINIIRITL